MEPYISLNDFRLIKPYQSIKKGHGIFKVNKPGMRLRPIINSMFSLTSGAEVYILRILRPLINKCSFSVSSTKHFTEKFRKISSKFTRFHEVVTFDAVSLFTSINVPKVVDYIIEKIYLDPLIYFPENNENTYPPKRILNVFLREVFLKYSAFWTINGYYRQKSGLSMGSKISPAISYIFLHMLESTII